MPDEEYYLVSRSDMEDVADTIREAGGTSAGLEWKAGWKTAITALSGGGGGGGTYQAKTNINPTTSSQTITPDTGYDALSSVQINAMPSGTAGTPTATKGTVSNHSISVTPSVTNTTGYITGSTKTGTAVTVSASELVSGSETKTANGTYDVTNLASLVVNVSGGASNVVTGTFKGTTTGAVMDVTLGYSGSGYPIVFAVYPEEGPYNNSTGTFYSLIQRYAVAYIFGIKSKMDVSPNYNSGSSGNVSNNGFAMYHRIKNSTSSATNYTGTAANQVYIAKNENATAGYNSTTASPIMLCSKNKMSVFIANTSYGFAANVTYKYWILYSS